MRYEVRLFNSPLVVEDETEGGARMQSYQAITESPDLLDVRALGAESDLPTPAEVQAIYEQSQGNG